MPGFIKNIGTTELIIIIAIVFLLFGGRIIKNFGKRVGESAKEVKKLKKELVELKDDEEEKEEESEDKGGGEE